MMWWFIIILFIETIHFAMFKFVAYRNRMISSTISLDYHFIEFFSSLPFPFTLYPFSSLFSIHHSLHHVIDFPILLVVSSSSIILSFFGSLSIFFTPLIGIERWAQKHFHTGSKALALRLRRMFLKVSIAEQFIFASCHFLYSIIDLQVAIRLDLEHYL